MAKDPQQPNPLEQAVSRALRDNLERIQKTSDELHQAINDVVSACASTKPGNALPHMLRAQTSAASMAAALEVLSRFIAFSLQPNQRSQYEEQVARLIGSAALPEAKTPPPPPAAAHAEPVGPEPVHYEPIPEPPPQPELSLIETAAIQIPVQAPGSETEFEGDFDVNRLSPGEQELHRRANRVAKVSMQDIKMLRPDQVRLGRENRDLCIRLKDDIEKAHREYDRRFKPIMDHPVDYFYRWMVEILGEGDPHALGDYPYSTPARHN
ncbi:MAG TPA: hypothetical protein VN982_08815 [Candidatus Dormibacteraeota bacterium]|nr:hypothetical protein [Candidatus Dormibacteraeota bacterium]